MKKFFYLLVLLLSIFFAGFIFAQNATQTPAQIQATDNQNTFEMTKYDELFTIYQFTNDNINRLIGALTFITSIFAIFITGLVFFFAFKQILADKEIREYKETIKQSKISIEKETKEQIENWKSTNKLIESKKQEMDKIIQQMKKEGLESSKKEEVEKLIKDFEELKKITSELKSQIDFQKGRISTSVSGIMSSTPITRSPLLDYPSSIDWLPRNFKYVTDPSLCSRCFSANNPDSKFCSNCGEPL